MISYDLEGSGELTEINTTNRRDAFMLHFDPVERVVTSAACIEPGQNETPADSPCLVSASTTEWQCRCFGYDFVREEMLWREFNAGDVPPMVSLSDVGAPATDGGSGTTSGGSGGGGSGGDGGATGDDVIVNVAEIMDVNSTFNFRPLPVDLFGSNGDNSRYIMQARANSVFDRVYDDPDRDPEDVCAPCVP